MDTKRWGEIKVDPDTAMTSRPGLWAAGDAVNGADLVVTAMAGAQRASLSIDRYLQALTEEYHVLQVSSRMESLG